MMFDEIFEPGEVAGSEVKNRVKYAACSVSNFNNPDGTITDRELARMETVSDTECGIITNQGAYPDPDGMGKGYLNQIAIYDESFIPGLETVADFIHDQDAMAIQQILHAGRYGGIDHDHCLQPSEVPQSLPHFREPRKMSIEEIHEVQDQHAKAAEIAVEAGFDGVEITSFMGYLLANFLSPATNKRDDQYGGDVEDRARFMTETFEKVRDRIGDEPLIVRLNGTELMDHMDGSTDEECLQYMEIADEAGVDMISMVIGWHESRKGALGGHMPTDQWLDLADNAQNRVDAPIAFGPQFADPHEANQALEEGIIDYWELCRPLLADPNMITKVREGRLNEIRPCVGKMECLSRMFRDLPYICTVNPKLGHEVEPEYHITEAEREKDVIVIGGGPAGMEAARVAVQRGHNVSLYEQREELGGQLLAGMQEPDEGRERHTFLDLIDYYRTKLDQLGVDVHLGTSVDKYTIRDLPGIVDVVILATGAHVDDDHVDANGEIPVVSAIDALRGDVELGDDIVVIGGERAGLVAAEHAGMEGKRVSVVESGSEIASDVIPTYAWRHKGWIKEMEIPTYKNAEYTVTDDSVEVSTPEDEVTIPADTLVATERRSTNGLYETLKFETDELYLIGDASKPRGLSDSIHEAYKLGARV